VIFVRYSSSTKEEGSSRHCLKGLLKSGIGCNLLAKLHFLALSFCVGDWFYERAMFNGCHNLFNDLALFDSD
jgi:hypothetical protein